MENTATAPVEDRLAALRSRIAAGREASSAAFAQVRNTITDPTKLVTDELRASLASNVSAPSDSDDFMPSPGLPNINTGPRQK